MLQPSLFVRKSLALAGVLLLLLSSSADALGLHRCAHHDGLPGARQEQAAHHGHHGDSSSHQDSQGCSCVGTCSLSSVALAPARAATHVVAAPASTRVHVAAAALVRALWQPHLLPYSTAPPAAL
jgi:hypothetical protein